MKIKGDMFEGTYLAQPAVRVIEAQLKIALIECDIIPNARYIKDKTFDMFEKECKTGSGKIYWKYLYILS